MSWFAAFALVWAILSCAVYGSVFMTARKQLTEYHDRRARHEYYIASALFICALSTLFSVVLGLLESGTLFRFGFSALALGAFLGAGIVIRLEVPRK